MAANLADCEADGAGGTNNGQVYQQSVRYEARIDDVVVAGPAVQGTAGSDDVVIVKPGLLAQAKLHTEVA